MYIVVLLILAAIAGALWAGRNAASWQKAYPYTRFVMYLFGIPTAVALLIGFFIHFSPIVATLVIWCGPIAVLAVGLVIGAPAGRAIAKSMGHS